MNIGEEICGEWLRHVSKCEFIQYNLKTDDNAEDDIDVIGINIAEQVIYVCEVAIHWISGLQYKKDERPDRVPRLIAKLKKDIAYIRQAFPKYKHVFMLWSPVVKKTGPGGDVLAEVQQIVDAVKTEVDESIESVINEKFQEALKALRAVAQEETRQMDSPMMRFLQVEEHLKQHLKNT